MATNQDLLEIYSSLRREVALRANSVLRASGLGTRQFIILRALSKKDQLTMSELVQWSLTDAATISRCIGQLEQHKLVKKVRCPKDKRVWRAQLTPAGSALVPKIETLFIELGQECFGALKPAEKKQLASLLNKAITQMAKG